MMKNTLSDLNNYLFESLENILDASDDKELNLAVKKGKAVKDISEAIIDNARVQLDAAKIQLEWGRDSKIVPDTLLEMKEVKNEGC